MMINVQTYVAERGRKLFENEKMHFVGWAVKYLKVKKVRLTLSLTSSFIVQDGGDS